MVRAVFYLVFLIPVTASVAFGGVVLAQSAESGGAGSFGRAGVDIIGLEQEYSTSDPVTIQVEAGEAFECGDLYITIYHSETRMVLTQGAFFEQCFADAGSLLPVDDEFSEVIGQPGSYEINIKISDSSQERTASASERFVVR